MCLHGVALELREGFSTPKLDSSLSFNTSKCKLTLVTETLFIQDAAERTPLFEKRINSKPKKIRQIFFLFLEST